MTDEALNNVHLCGFGTGGRFAPHRTASFPNIYSQLALFRLGQTTQMQFNFAPLHDFPYEVASVSLSP